MTPDPPLHPRAGDARRPAAAFAALAALPDGVVVLAPVRDQDGALTALRCELANPAAEGLLGRPSSELVGRPIDPADLGVAAAELLDGARRVLAEGRGWRHEVRAGAGALASAFRLRLDPAGDRLVLTLRDVSRRRRTERLAERVTAAARAGREAGASAPLLRPAAPPAAPDLVGAALAVAGGAVWLVAADPVLRVAAATAAAEALAAAAGLEGPLPGRRTYDAIPVAGVEDLLRAALDAGAPAEHRVEVAAGDATVAHRMAVVPAGRALAVTLTPVPVPEPHEGDEGVEEGGPATVIVTGVDLVVTDASGPPVGDVGPIDLLGRPAPLGLWRDDDEERHEQALRRAVAGAASDLVLAPRSGSPAARVPVGVSPLRTTGGGVVGTVTTVGAPMTGGVPGEQAARAAEASALHRVALAVASGAEPYECFDLAADAVLRLLGARAAGVVRFDEGGRGTLMAAVEARGAAADRGADIPLGDRSAVAEVARTGEPARVEDLAGAGGPEGDLAAMLGLRSSVAAPVRLGGVIWGAVAAVGEGEAALPAGSERLMVAFGDLAALAVANAQDRERLATQALTDALTALPNRRAFEEQLAMEVERATRHGYPLSLALIDVDHFKRVNDELGHAAGDRVLAEIARRLARLSRGGEMVARVGGEEFAWILPGASVGDAVAAVERASRSIAAEPVSPAGRLTVSAGVSDLAGTGDGTRLVETADRALYLAKSRGRNLTVPLSLAPPA